MKKIFLMAAHSLTVFVLDIRLATNFGLEPSMIKIIRNLKPLNFQNQLILD
ncbi:MAG: hypothetical protein IPP61_12770 [Cytophagaceae bacterium]|nr:hypothetical protein [Cytophagaceae bacterium]